jgi:hypothetical protein
MQGIIRRGEGLQIDATRVETTVPIMLVTSLGRRLPQVDPAYGGHLNAVERAMMLDSEGELSMPRIVTMRMKMFVHFHGTLRLLAQKRKNKRRFSASSNGITPDTMLQRRIVSLALGFVVQHRCSS